MARRPERKMLTCSQLFERLEDPDRSTSVFRGRIDRGRDEDHVRFSIGGTAAGGWLDIPLRLVESVQPLARVDTGESTHHWVNLELRRPEVLADGHAFASIAQDFAASAHASPASASVGMGCPDGYHASYNPNKGTYECVPGAP